MVASMRIATAMATPKILNSISDSVAKIENTATMITAALVTTPALRAMPSLTAVRQYRAAYAKELRKLPALLSTAKAAPFPRPVRSARAKT